MKILLSLLYCVFALGSLAQTSQWERAQTIPSTGELDLIPKDKRGSQPIETKILFFDQKITRGSVFRIGVVKTVMEEVKVPKHQEAQLQLKKISYEPSWNDKNILIAKIPKKKIEYTSDYILVTGYKGNPLAAGEKVTLNIKRLGVYKYGTKSIPFYRAM